MSHNEISDELYDCLACGRLIGQATGWDQADTWTIRLYDFVPSFGYKGPIVDKSGCLCIDFEVGFIQAFNEHGQLIGQVDLLEAIKDCEIKRNVNPELTLIVPPLLSNS